MAVSNVLQMVADNIGEKRLATHHNAEAQAERRGKEGIALLDAEVAFARDEADRNVDADDGCAEDTGEAAEGAHDPASRIVVHIVGVHGGA